LPDAAEPTMRIDAGCVAFIFALGFLLGFGANSLISIVHSHDVEERHLLNSPEHRHIRNLEKRLSMLEAERSDGEILRAERIDGEADAVATPRRGKRRARSRSVQDEFRDARPKEVRRYNEILRVAPEARQRQREREVPETRQEAPEVQAPELVQAKGPATDPAVERGCPKARKPYHVILTAQDSPYQAWQSRIMHYHLRKIQKANPCTEITGFTRMLSSVGAKPDGLMAEMPTVLVSSLDSGRGCAGSDENSCDFGFPVMNRPHGMNQFLDRLPATLTEEYVLIAETDHVLLRDLPNKATPHLPECFPFAYMNPTSAELKPVVSRFVDDPQKVDPCGPSPTIIHTRQLALLAPEWLRLSFELKRDAEADKAFGWVLEMWGYTLAARRLGITHTTRENLQAEPSAIWHTELDGDPFILHYTFGFEYTSDGIPVRGGIGEWSLDKRHFMSHHPPRGLEPPPECAGKAAKTLHRLFDEAARGIPDWPSTLGVGGARGTLGWAPGAEGAAGGATGGGDAPSRTARRLVTMGPYTWEGKGRLLFFTGGRAHTPWGSASWHEIDANDSAKGMVVAIHLGACGTWTLRFPKRKRLRSFKAYLGDRETSGMLAKGSEDAAVTNWDDSAPVVRRLLGSGPWAWEGVAPLGFLGGGRLVTPWGAGKWGAHPSEPGAIYANFVGEEHTVRIGGCWMLSSVRKKDGDRATGGALIAEKPKHCAELEPSADNDT